MEPDASRQEHRSATYVSAPLSYAGYQITIETTGPVFQFGVPHWSARFAYERDGQVIQSLVEACARQKTFDCAEQKALRFAKFAIDTRLSVTPAPPGPAGCADQAERPA